MNSEQWVVKASDNTDYVLAYADGMYCVTDKYGSVICEFIKCNTKNKEKWHVVTDGDLPKKFEYVFVTTKDGGRTIAHRMPNQKQPWYDLHSTVVKNVIAWKELPEAYKPEERE